MKKRSLIISIFFIFVVMSTVIFTQCTISYNYATLKVINNTDHTIIFKGYFIDNSGDQDSQGIVVKPIVSNKSWLVKGDTDTISFTWLKDVNKGYFSASWGVYDSTPSVYDFMIEKFLPILDGQDIIISIDNTSDYSFL